MICVVQISHNFRMSTGLDALGDIFILAQWVGYFMEVGPRVGFFTEIGPGGGDLCERWPQGREFGTKILPGGGEFGKKSWPGGGEFGQNFWPGGSKSPPLPGGVGGAKN